MACRAAVIFGGVVVMVCATTVQAQSTVGELQEKGGALVGKEEFATMLPLRMEGQWPNRQGEEVLYFSVDGKITGKGFHYSSRSESPAEGSWTMEADGRLCKPQKFTAWPNSSTNNCYYMFKLGSDYYSSVKNEVGSAIRKVKSVAKVDQIPS